MTTRLGDARLYVSTQEGRIHVIAPGANGAAGTASKWFDVNSLAPILGSAGQQGLQSAAFHPEFDKAGTPGYGKLYTTMLRTVASNTAGESIYLGESPRGGGVPADSVLAEFTYDHTANTFGGYRELFRVKMPLNDHPIKQARFNPHATPDDEDYGLLYVSHGDSNFKHSPGDYPRLLNNVLGKVLRLNPLESASDRYTIPTGNPFSGSSDPNVLTEIFAYGFRNPHTFSFNRDGNGVVRILVGDIGRNNIEEINLVVSGANYGWPTREGTFFHRQLSDSDPDAGYITGVAELPSDEASFDNTYPVAQYDHNAQVSEISSGSSVASGFVIRNGSDPNLHNQLIFSNFAAKDGIVYHVDFNAMLRAVTTLDPEDSTRDEPSELTQATLHKLNMALDHDNNPATPAQIFGDFSELLGTVRNDARYGEGVFGEMYISTKQQGGRIYLVTNSLPLAGDYNKDRSVDAADYVVWRDMIGDEGYRLAADGNGDGKIDAADYAVWQDNFGATWSTTGNGASGTVLRAVPETTSLWLTVVLAFGFISANRRFQRRIAYQLLAALY
jgi:glucose/arabinose dehydrogenase